MKRSPCALVAPLAAEPSTLRATPTNAGTMSRRPIAVIAGAGPSGLTAAYELLARTNVRPLIFERTHAIGGIAQTYNYKGNRIDIGGDPFFSKSRRGLDLGSSLLA